jgi:hypothetical protein
MNFAESARPLSDADFASTERKLGVVLPAALRQIYLQSNGGVPEPYVYEDENLDTVVSEFLPLSSASTGRLTSEDVYLNAVIGERLVPAHFFPFAVDGAGSFFLVDCRTDNADVYFYTQDTAYENLRPLGIGVVEFFARLKPED